MVESEILIDFLKGTDGARAVLEKAADDGVIRVSAISAAEVIAQATGDNLEPAQSMLDSFGIVPVDKGVASLAGLFFARGRRDKLELGRCLIAATCAELGAALVTRDPSKYPRDGFEVQLADY
ncbi:MAG: PIN domain-containing protein [Candidatus Geothermincolia bacterium]